MELMTKAIETTGIVDAQHRLLLDESLPVTASSRVRVIVVVTKEADKKNDQTCALSSDSSDPLPSAMRLAAAIYWYQRGEISQERAAEIAQLNRRDFLEALAHEKRDVFLVDFNDLKEELARG